MIPINIHKRTITNRVIALAATAIFISLALLFGYGNVISSGLPRNLHDDEKAVISRIVTTSFFDPASAQFNWSMLRRENKYCGYVNGKNRMGGYVGFRLFTVVPNLSGGRIISVEGLWISSGINDPLESSQSAACQDL
jgi:hypothetical protein